MKQAWGWLMAGVVAAGLNASYHDGGLRMVHEMVGRAGHNVEAVLALASGNADQFLTQARLVTARKLSDQQVTAEEAAPSCPLARAMARVETRVARSDANWARFEAFGDREQARLDRSRARFEANMARVAQVRMPAAALQPMVYVNRTACSRVRVSVPQISMPKMPAMPDVRVAVNVDPL